MSGTGNEFERLMERVRTGDPAVGREIFERYGKAIQMVVRHRLDPRMRSQFDSLDFAQDAWASFFRMPAEGFSFQSPEELVAFLSRVVRHKMIDAYRQRCRSSKENGRTFLHTESYLDLTPARQPTPSQLAISEEAWRRLIENKPPKIQRALEMLRDGYTHREIAECLEINIKQIQRLVKNLSPRVKSP